MKNTKYLFSSLQIFFSYWATCEKAHHRQRWEQMFIEDAHSFRDLGIRASSSYFVVHYLFIVANTKKKKTIDYANELRFTSDQEKYMLGQKLLRQYKRWIQSMELKDLLDFLNCIRARKLMTF